MTDDRHRTWTDADIDAALEASRIASEVPKHVTDPVLLDRLAILFEVPQEEGGDGTT